MRDRNGGGVGQVRVTVEVEYRVAEYLRDGRSGGFDRVVEMFLAPL